MGNSQETGKLAEIGKLIGCRPEILHITPLG